MTRTVSRETPLMKQYNSIKSRYPDAVLLFRVGDFYETFGEDAVKASKILGIVLTRRANGAASEIELAGFPHHSLDSYLPKLVRAGYRVAICDQLEDPRFVKGIVKRGITELVTPGVSFNDKILNHKQNNFLGAICYGKDKTGLSLCDISTGEFLVAEGSIEYVEKLIQNFRPNELLFDKGQKEMLTEVLDEKMYSFGLDEWVFDYENGYNRLVTHFETGSLKGYGIDELGVAIQAAGAILHYLGETRHDKIRHVTGISRLQEDQYVWLDKFTIRNLELYASNNDQGKSLCEVIDRTVSPMGSRLLKRWLALPLRDITAISERLDITEFFMKEPEIREELIKRLKETGDLERLISRISAFKAGPRELVHLKRALGLIDEISQLFGNSGGPAGEIAGKLDPCTALRERLDKELNEDAPVQVLKGDVFKEYISQELDELRNIAFKGKDHLLGIQRRETERTGISSLKVAYNSVFGYYLEVTNVHKEKVPPEWIRKQTLTNAERYVTPELKDYEEKILGAEEKISAIEQKLFEELLRGVSEYIVPVQSNAALLARLDVLSGYAVLAAERNYARPELNDGYAIDIVEGRHPVIEQQLAPGIEYVSNSVYLDNENTQVMMITGPNMSGKSALLRQTALIVLMAQTGSYVPAREARLGITDKIFTRVGATDNISSGESTFMVEMNETASILNNLSDRSLVLLDEIGRGTSTYDGISIAWSIAEYIHNQSLSRARTLFATHYHELNEMTNFFPRIKNFNVSVKESGNKIIFLRKLREGGSEHSFGIHVARMAGMPSSIIGRANEILKKLEKEHELEFEGVDNLKVNGKARAGQGSHSDLQLSFFQLNDPLLQQIKEDILQIDIDTLTPVEALLKLNEIKKLVGG